MSGVRRRRLPRRTRFSGQSFNRMLPNLMTLMGLCIGLSAIRLAMNGKYGDAVIALAVSAVIDGLDGRLARLLKATSRFGAEFDSLADFLCFGIAPALVIYMWSLEPWGAIGFLPPLMYASAMALRLARFNAALDSAPKAAFAYNFFTGVPAPAGAGLALCFRCSLGWKPTRPISIWLRDAVGFPLFTGAVLVAVSLLLRLHPTRSGASRISKSHRRRPAAAAGRGGLRRPHLLPTRTPPAPCSGIAYITMLPFSLRSYRRLAAAAESRRAAAEVEE
jgi:CDP-diacylglycerol--serine O-phosphatidyltransferase